MGELPPETARPLLLSLWDRGGFEDAILPILAHRPQPADRDKFLTGLRSPQLARMSQCLDALNNLPAASDAGELLSLVRVLRVLGESKAEVGLRERVVRRLQKLTGQQIGPDKAAWSAWLTKAHPDLAAKLGGADGADVTAWQKRFAGIDWSAGDAGRGKTTFTKASCATCHSGGSAVGPDLRGARARFGRDDLLTAIIQPSKDIAPRLPHASDRHHRRQGLSGADRIRGDRRTDPANRPGDDGADRRQTDRIARLHRHVADASRSARQADRRRDRGFGGVPESNEMTSTFRAKRNRHRNTSSNSGGTRPNFDRYSRYVGSNRMSRFRD